MAEARALVNVGSIAFVRPMIATIPILLHDSGIRPTGYCSRLAVRYRSEVGVGARLQIFRQTPRFVQQRFRLLGDICSRA
jgi:hypothetical protein